MRDRYFPSVYPPYPNVPESIDYIDRTHTNY
jgi:hypothetical protein